MSQCGFSRAEPPQSARESNITVHGCFWTTLYKDIEEWRKNASRLALPLKHHFRQSVLGNLCKCLGSQSPQIDLNCSYLVIGPTVYRKRWATLVPIASLCYDSATSPALPGGAARSTCALGQPLLVFCVRRGGLDERATV